MILLTGFERFSDLDCNPSELIVQCIAERAHERGETDLVTEVLPMEYGRAENRIRMLIREFKPQAIVGLGVAAGAQGIRLERVALNLDDSDEPDNSGEIARGRLIQAKGLTAYWSTLPLPRMLDALRKLGIPAFISNHAGTFVCNHIFYVARHQVARLHIRARCGFIHVPLRLEDVKRARGSEFSLPLPVMVEGIECCLNVLRDRPTAVR